MSDPDAIAFDRLDDGRVDVITLQRHAKRNALSPEIVRRLHDTLSAAAADDSRVVLIRSGLDKVFCAGFDIEHLSQAGGSMGTALLHACFDLIESCSKPVVAFADGLATGGGLQLFVSCDIRLATSRASFQMPALRLCQVEELSGLERFVRVVGLSTTQELYLTARRVGADRAVDRGIASWLVDDYAEALEQAQAMAEASPLALGATKRVLDLASRPADERSAARRRRDVERLRKLVHESPDRREALSAFAEKRSPTFPGEPA